MNKRKYKKLKNKFERLQKQFDFYNECGMNDGIYIDELESRITQLKTIINETDDKKRILELEQELQKYKWEDELIEEMEQGY